MKSRPILMSWPMVVACLRDRDRKTQTRRSVKGVFPVTAPDGTNNDCIKDIDGLPSRLDMSPDNWELCPYGQPGDRLWVREEHFRFGHWEAVTGAKARTRTGRQRWRFVPDSAEVLYEAPASFRKGRHHKDHGTVAWHKRLARFMPRAFCRIQLEIVRVRVERLQEISEADAIAEGVERNASLLDGSWGPEDGYIKYPLTENLDGFPAWTAIESYKSLWESINGPGSWDANPWVWVVEFKRVTS